MSQSIVYALPLVAAVVAGCSAPPAKHAPNDEDGITVHCNKSTLRWNTCYETAANLCGERGFQILSNTSSEMPTVTTNAYEVPVIGGSMLIRCNQ